MTEIRKYINILSESVDGRPEVVGDPGVVTEATSKEEILLKILRDANLSNEEGEDRVEFKVQNRDSLDYGTVAIWTLETMLDAAYEAGKAASREAE